MPDSIAGVAIRASERCLLGLEQLVPELASPAQELLVRIAPEQWTLEWYLPYWLGTSLGLPVDVCETLVLCNVYGLGYVRLQDDLADGEVARGGERSAVALSSALYHLALREYARLFDPGSPFWSYLERWLGEWMQATLRGEDQATGENLGQRGAPLKIGCAAACLLAGREDKLPLLSSALDETLAAAVLLDHAIDWAGDLAACRHNALVAALSPWPQDEAHRGPNRTAVLEALFAGSGRAYFERLHSHLKAAQRLAVEGELPEICAHLDRLAREAEECERQMVDVPQERIHDLTATIFGPPSELEKA